MKTGTGSSFSIKGILIGGTVLLVTIGIVHQVRREAGAKFRQEAISQISNWSKTGGWQHENIAFLAGKHTSAHPAPGDADWLADNLIEMANGEWIVYFASANQSDWKVGDNFVGRASNGKWYYSTYRFGDMAMLHGQPFTLDTFAMQYALREFSGSPAEELEPTDAYRADAEYGECERGLWARFHNAAGTKYLVLLELPKDRIPNAYYIGHGGAGFFRVRNSLLLFSLGKDGENVTVDQKSYNLSDGLFFRIKLAGPAFEVSQLTMNSSAANLDGAQVQTKISGKEAAWGGTGSFK